MLRQRLETTLLRVLPGFRSDDESSLHLDSLQIVALIDEIEKEFSISIPTFQLFMLTQKFSLDDLERAVVEQQAGKNQSS